MRKRFCTTFSRVNVLDPGNGKIQKQFRMYRENPAWTELGYPYGVGSSFLRSGSDALHQLKISFEAFYHPEEHRADMLVTFGALCEGPPGHVHGGAISAIADTCMGICAWYSGIACVTANLNVNYKSKIPLLNSCILTSRIGKVEGRKITLEYEMKSTEGVLHSNGCALFIQLKDSERIDPNKVIEEWHNPKSPMVTDW